MNSQTQSLNLANTAPVQWRFAWLFVLCNGPVLFWPFSLNGPNVLWAVFSAWAPLLCIHLLVPVLDWLLPRDLREPVTGQTHPINKAMPMLCLPLWLLALFMAIWQLSGPVFIAANLGMPDWARVTQLMGIICSLGAIGGTLAINPAHELIHRNSPLERNIGGLLLAATCYGAFKIEHVRGHHLHVATGKDTASAKRGQNVFSFAAKSCWSTLVNGHRLETQRLSRLNLSAYSLEWFKAHELIRWNVVSLVLMAVFFLLSGWLGLLVFLGASLGAIFELEVINFIEHYGLERKIDHQTGRPEVVRPIHSWNTSTSAGNVFLFNLQRHSDHHAHAGKDYLHLENCADAPQMPFGYGGMMLMALCPPIWRRVMHPRLDALKDA